MSNRESEGKETEMERNSGGEWKRICIYLILGLNLAVNFYSDIMSSRQSTWFSHHPHCLQGDTRPPPPPPGRIRSFVAARLRGRRGEGGGRLTTEGEATTDSCVKKVSGGRCKRERNGRRGTGSRKTYETDEIMGGGVGGVVIWGVSSGWWEWEREKVDRRAAVQHQREFCGILHQRAGKDALLYLHSTHTLI